MSWHYWPGTLPIGQVRFIAQSENLFVSGTRCNFLQALCDFLCALQISPFSKQTKQGWQCHWWFSFLTMCSEEQLSGFVSAGNNFHIVSSLFGQGSLDSFHQIRMDSTAKSPIRRHNHNQVVWLGFVCFTWGYFYLLIQSWKIKLTD